MSLIGQSLRAKGSDGAIHQNYRDRPSNFPNNGASEAAQSAALEIKTEYPIVQVSIYDSVDNSHRLVELPGAAS